MYEHLANRPLFQAGTTRRLQTNALICSIATQSGRKPSTVFKRVYSLTFAYYGINVYGYPKAGSWLKVAEQHDVLDKVYLASLSEYLHVVTEGQSHE